MPSSDKLICRQTNLISKRKRREEGLEVCSLTYHISIGRKTKKTHLYFASIFDTTKFSDANVSEHTLSEILLFLFLRAKFY